MNAPARNRFVAWLKDVEFQLDGWAAKRMTPEEYAEGLALDHQLKRNFWKWLSKFSVLVGLLGLILLSLWPHLGLARALGFSAIGCTYVLIAIVSAWYGYRNYTRRPPWKVFALFIVLVLGGAMTGFVIANANMGRPLGEIDPEKLARSLAVALSIGLALAAILMGIAHLRLREATQKSARLQAEADRERLARQHTQAQLKLLQAQVEPHFLFNTLSNLRYMVQTGSADALPMLDHLMLYLRTMLPEMRVEGSTLGREAELARAYLEIMRLRMGGALDVAIDVPAGLAEVAFPPLMIMTLMENAIKHGVAPVGHGRIALRAFEEEGHIGVEVQDDGRGLLEPIGQGLGLANIRERLKALHGEAARLELRGREPTGTIACIRVPAR